MQMTAVLLWLASPCRLFRNNSQCVFLAATRHNIVITTGGFRQMSVEVLGLTFIYFIAHSPSAKRATLNCLFNVDQRMEWLPADVVCQELQKPQTNVLFQCLSRAFL